MQKKTKNNTLFAKINILFSILIYSNLFSCEGMTISEKEYCLRTSPKYLCGLNWACTVPAENASASDRQKYNDCISRSNTNCLLQTVAASNRCKHTSTGKSSLLLKYPHRALTYDPETDDSHDSSGL